MNVVRRTTFCLTYRLSLTEAQIRAGAYPDASEKNARERAQRMELTFMSDPRGAESITLTQSVLRAMSALKIAPTYEALADYLDGGMDYGTEAPAGWAHIAAD